MDVENKAAANPKAIQNIVDHKMEVLIASRRRL